jgi:ketosteroid isomerase-like protein
MSTEDEVRKASTQFYAALNRMCNGDAAPMTDIWSHSSDATTMHPIGGREVGWERVKGPWEQIAKMSTGGEVILNDQLIRVSGDMAYEVGVERGHLTLGGTKVAFEHRVTNVYRKEAGGWRIVHHHTDVSAAMVDVLSRLQAKTQ